MAVTGSSDEAEAVEQVKFYSVCAVEGAVGPVLVRLIVPLLKMLINKFTVYREQINTLVGSLIKPCEMVDAQYIDMNIVAVNIFDAQSFLTDAL